MSLRALHGLHRGPALAIVGVVIGVTAGCASTHPVARRVAGMEAGRQGRSWEAVLPGARLPVFEPDGESARRNVALNAQPDRPLLASNEWPHAPRPRLERSRRLYTPSDPRSTLYFRAEPDRGPGWWCGW